MAIRNLFPGLALILALAAAGCSSGVDASKARSQAVIQSGGIVAADEIRVAEYVGHYKQNFPSPVDSAAGLDLRLGNTQVPADGGPAWLQIGVQARDAESDVIAPLNLALVIDHSGSMNSPEKLPYVKQSLKLFIQSLAPNDLVSIVIFDDEADVIVPSTRVGDGKWIDEAVDRISPGGSTNLNDGLSRGFEEASRNYDIRRNNRVILLTDGVANTGETNPQKIASMARGYNDKGIYLSTIGLGQGEFNDALLIQLANQGKGAYHFINSAAEMDKVFRQEVSGLFQKAASDVSITIRPDPSVTIESITGYEGRPPAGPVQVRLRDMGTGDNQVVLARMNLAPSESGRRPVAAVELRYQDLFSKREGGSTQTVVAQAVRTGNYDPTWDVEVLRNVTIQRTAEGLKEIDRLSKARSYQSAWDLAYGLEQDLRAVARLSNDPELLKDADAMRKYEDTLAKIVQRETGRLPLAPKDDGSRVPQRGRELLPAPAIDIR